MPPRARAWLAREVPSRPGAAMAGLLFLAGAAISLATGGVLPAAIFGAGAAFILVAYLATYGGARLRRGDEERLG